MIIDFHNHTYPDKIAQETVDKLSDVAGTQPYLDGTAKTLSMNLQKSGVDLGVVLPVATAPRQVEKINTYAVNVQKEYSNLISIGTMHPDFENYKEEIKRIKELGLKGIKVHPDYQKTFFDDIKYLNIFEEAFKNDLFVVTHGGIDIGLPDPVHCNIQAIINVIDALQIKDEKLVLAHMGGWKLWDKVLEKICGKNVYFDTAFSIGKVKWKHKDGYLELMENNQFEEIVKAHGADKILFATDSPWGGHIEHISALNDMNISQEEKDWIFFKTAKKLLRI